MVRFLCIVASDQPELCEYLSHHFADDDSVRVSLDRRRGERRRSLESSDLERRRGHRRWYPDNEETLRSVGIFMVPLNRQERPACPVS